MRRVLLLGLILLASGCRGSRIGAEAAAAARPAAAETPALKPDALPTGRHGHRVQLHGDTLYVLGGFARGSPKDDRGSREALAYDFARDAWRNLPDMHAGKAFFSSALAGGALWTIGGVIERLDLVSERWEVVCRDARIPSSHFAAAADAKTLYVIGEHVTAFDLGTRELKPLAPWPGKKPGDHFHVVAMLDGTLHVVGGLDGESFQPMAAHWTLSGGSWSRLLDAPEGLFAKFSVVEVADGALYVFTSGRGLRFDPRERTWTKVAGMPAWLAMPASFVRAGWIHVLGGLPVDESPTRLSYELAKDRWIVVGGS